MIDDFFNYPFNKFLDWFDIIIRDTVIKYLIEDFNNYCKVSFKFWYLFIPSKRLELKLLSEFLNSGYPRIKNWFQADSDLWERLREQILIDYGNYLRAKT